GTFAQQLAPLLSPLKCGPIGCRCLARLSLAKHRATITEFPPLLKMRITAKERVVIDPRHQSPKVPGDTSRDPLHSIAYPHSFPRCRAHCRLSIWCLDQ